DTDGGVHPDADEVCDGVDNDCDGAVDDADGDLLLATTSCWYEDLDGDGAGAPGATVEACVQPAGRSDNDTDCDDTDPTPCTGQRADQQGIPMIYLAPGSFMMGSPPEELGRTSAEALHQVTLTRGLYVGAYEVTQDQFVAAMGYQPSAVAGCPDCPAETMSWYEAMAFANAVSASAGLGACYTCAGAGTSIRCELSSSLASPYACEGYRLPTMAEWEYAARAGSGAAFWTGGSLLADDLFECGGVVLDDGTLLDDLALYCGNTDGAPLPVGQTAPNPWGLYDVYGNVAEWCQEGVFGVSDPVDPWDASSRFGVAVKGGGFGSTPLYLRAASRMGSAPDLTSGMVGIRLVRTE
ncbi:MAG: SUMF1/EgtB/PvdO family nonheme iron enzyme, partial [Deltaproteobacteria bacterium]|nr:SUMF1/EgtB/PvdO family nonheme iron enzyme [Deltaproteobacteria bacterium]